MPFNVTARMWGLNEFPHSQVFAHLGFDASSLGAVEQLGRTWRGILFMSSFTFL